MRQRVGWHAIVISLSLPKALSMLPSTRAALTKVPEVTIGFWLLKIAVTTLGETAGDALSMSMNLGYLLSTAIFATLFLLAVMAQIRAARFHPLLYWSTLVATTTVGTTLADFADRSLGIGYAGGATLLLALLLASLLIWYRRLGSLAMSSIHTPGAELFYWFTIMFSQTLGTALGDWSADSAGLGYLSVWQPAGLDRGTLLLEQAITHAAVLGRLHPDPPAWGRTR